ncbi:HlyD family type I secretion periplasmic adaptor subunit [Rhizobium indigoferae]|uniref:Membrane fusion protein (MFP) family protein n=1 Tax=Rhizobium indigoferae TaxID=158891 RepID=A0ABZ0ZBG8_9HYPH|nr:HlyD family type I secretion periplasmic adaptor subunit [Rhizobium indigoferae]NNU57212.1 HlyD family type I secretion periplasmic adaptor subunit [Rhizobium indigoferae]WQN35794.1 HlyD family type I secretion periplasmic adaptor subunit [Rhizobium indigoferae]GLR58271.1 HlyD family type I secretion periplasmic adaptor subunit [Rhizobium indigoferae]
MKGGPAQAVRYAGLPSRPLKRSDHEFLAPAIEILETPPSPVRLALIMIICAFVTTALIWSYIGRIDIIAAAQGKIQPTGRVKVVQPLLTGKVKALPPSNGTHIKSGDILLELDPTDAIADETDATKGLASVRAEVRRRKTAVDYVRSQEMGQSLPPISWDADAPDELRGREEGILRGDLGQYQAAVASLDAQKHQKEVERDRLIVTVAAEKSLVETLKERVAMRNTLASKEAGTMASVIDATETLKEQVTQLVMQEGQLADAAAGIEVLAREKDKLTRAFLSDQLERLGNAERRVEELEQRLAKARNVREQMSLRSPIDGTVQASSITSVGQVVTVGEDVMRVVPEGSTLELEVYALNKDIGFIKVGQDAVVKLEAFPFTRYGTIPARVIKIAADAIPEPDAARREGDPVTRQAETAFGGAERIQNLVFPVTLSLQADQISADGRKVKLSAGMAAIAEVRTGERRILEYVFSPLVEVAEEALHER